MVKEDVWIKTVCYNCQSSCTGTRVHRIDGVLRKIEGDPDCPPNYGRQCLKGLSALMAPYDPQRPLKPLKRTNPEKGLGIDPKWLEISWEEATDIVVENLKKIRKDNPLKFMVATFDYPTNIFYIPWVLAYGGQFWISGAYWCGMIHHVCWQNLWSFFREVDYANCNYFVLIGTASGFLTDVMPTLGAKRMADARLRGMKLVVVDPVCTVAASKADEWIPIRPGTDGAFALCWSNLLVNEYGLYDAEFLKKYTNGPYLIGPDEYYVRDKETGKPLVWDSENKLAKTWDAVHPSNMALEGEYTVDGVKCRSAFHLLKDHLKKYKPEEVSEITTIPAETIRRIAEEFGKAAKIGSKITIDGVELPYRPACVLSGKGAFGHRHAQHTAFALDLPNVLVGNLNVPGGELGVGAGYKRWAPKIDSDGFSISPNWYFKWCNDQYPVRPVTKPKMYTLEEIHPLAPYYCNFPPIVMQDPKLFGIDYNIEFLVISHNNPLFNSANPGEIYDQIKKIPLVLGFASPQMTDSIEACDLVIPAAHPCTERYDPIANPPYKFEGVGYEEDWYWFFRRPVLEPPPNVKDWVEFFYDLTERVGFLKEFNEMINWFNDLREPNKLDHNKKYGYLEIYDHIMKDRYGIGIDWYEKNNTQVYVQKKTVQEAFPRPFIKGRCHIYFEHWKRAGEEVRKVVSELPIKDRWDLSDYKPLLDWSPCPSFKPKGEYDLMLVNYKVPFHTFSYTIQNPWLNEAGSRYPWVYGIQVNSKTADEREIKNGDEIWVESEFGYKVRGRAVVTECIHPECVGIAGEFGQKAYGQEVARGVGVHWGELATQDVTHFEQVFDPVSESHDLCTRVKIYKAKEEMSDG